MMPKSILKQTVWAAVLTWIAGVMHNPALAQRTADQEAAKSVVRIDCITDSGEKKATGFVWPKRGYAVTALHAVAGCNSLRVHSEATGTPASASVVRALKIADLALIHLDNDMGLEATIHQEQAPNTRDNFFIWGYPLVAVKLLDKPISFAGGLDAGITSLGEAFQSDQLDKLFDVQDYPKRETQILRVNTTIQPGHSGAPIFSEGGRVVAIADGGLLDGWRGVNWSIPAYLYLPLLIDSEDVIPTIGTKSDGLFSQATAVTTALTVGPSHSNVFRNLKLVRSLTLNDLDAIVPADDFYADLFTSIRLYPSIPESDLRFNIFEDEVTGATLGVPSIAQVTWNNDLGIVEAVADNGAVRMFVGVLQAETYEEVKEIAAREFLERAGRRADWSEQPSDFKYSYVYDDFEHANFADFFNGHDRETGQPVSLQVDVDVTGQKMLAWAVYSQQDTSDVGAVSLMMMQLAGEKLSDYALK